MKKLILLLVASAINIAQASAQLEFKANTGDSEMDGILKTINDKAKSDMNTFTNEVATKFNIVKSKIDQVVKIMAPGDIFMSAQVASIVKKPFEEVSKTFQANKEKGWGVIAKEMGIKPGSPEFHEMKKALKSHGNGPGNGNGKAGENGNSKAKGKGKKK